MSADADLAELATAYGIFLSYRDLQDQEQVASPDTLRALLAANFVPASTPAELRESLRAVRAEKTARRFPREVIIPSGQETRVASGDIDNWQLRNEDSTSPQDVAAAKGDPWLPSLRAGIYSLNLRFQGKAEMVRVIASPACAPSLFEQSGHERIWGVNLALYGLHSERNSGLGDYSDLREIAIAAGGEGAGFVGINPIHAMGISSDEISPYAPSHRGFFNTDHIAVDSIPGLENSPAARRIRESVTNHLVALRQSKHVDYMLYRLTHRHVTEQLYDLFRVEAPESMQQDFTRFCHEGHDTKLARFVAFETLSGQYGADWRNWPSHFRYGDPGTGYHQWLQWVATRQLESAQRGAKDSGMALGLYHDIAVGARRGGAESWCERESVACHVSVGAPPDHLNPNGQNWNLAAYSPHRLKDAGYRPFRDILAQVMKVAGMVRIDHIMGLQRSFWIPDDGSPGGFVRQNYESLIALLKIEAVRQGTVVIGEDLGLASPGFRRSIRQHGIYGLSVLQYEIRQREKSRKSRHGSRSVARQELACFATHDTPTVRGFKHGIDIDWWHRLGWIDGDGYVAAHKLRRRDIRAVKAKHPGIGFSKAVQTSLAVSPASMVGVQLDDICQHRQAQNLPGTTDEHPNWRRRYRISVSELARHKHFLSVAKSMHGRRSTKLCTTK